MATERVPADDNDEVSELLRSRHKPLPPSELDRRRRLLEDTFALREAIGRTGLTTVELLADPEEGVDD